MERLNLVDWVCLTLVIIGGINWGLVGLFNMNLVALLFGNMSTLSKLVYSIVGIASVYLIFTAIKISNRSAI